MDSLKSVLLPEKMVTFDFPGCPGFKVDLVFLSKENQNRLYKKCFTTKFSSKNRQASEEFNEELFLKLYIESVVKGWEGFKLRYLNELALTNISEDQLEDELSFSIENAIDLVKSSQAFDNWINEVTTDLSNFTKINSDEK